MVAQIRRMQKLAKPLGIKIRIRSLQDVRAFLNRVVQLQTDKKLEPMETRTLIDAAEVLRKIFQPSEIEAKVDELLKETTTLRETVSQLRKSRSDQSRARGNTKPDPPGSRAMDRTNSNPKG
jgi:predicted nucleotidyltransferase